MRTDGVDLSRVFPDLPLNVVRWSIKDTRSGKCVGASPAV
jgi:hypothetical protein